MQAKCDDLPGHMKDAWLHEMGDAAICEANGYLIPSDEQFAKMAEYLIPKIHDDDSDYKAAYTDLRDAVEYGLDICDDRGDTLRTYKFGSSGFVKTLQEILLNGLSSAATHIF